MGSPALRIVITDSGVGGLSVCAYAERRVRERGMAMPVRLIYANAAPANDYGYNAMASRAEQLATFERCLAAIVARDAPDRIYVACNTLSVLLPEVRPVACPVTGIIATGVERLLAVLEAEPARVALIFATPTTIAAGEYPRRLAARGIAAARIVDQACPGLADTISEDRDGSAARAAIARWVGAVLPRLPAGAPVAVCLACTHYGYRRALFADALADAGVAAVVVDPNVDAVADVLGPAGGDHHDVEVELVTRYALPAATVDTLTALLGDIAPRTVAAMQRFTHVPALF